MIASAAGSESHSARRTPYSCIASSGVGRRVVHEGLDAELVQLADDVDHLRVADVGHVLLEGEAEHVDARALDVAAGVDHLLHGLARDVLAHAVVDAPPGEDHLGVVAERARPCASGSTGRRRCSARRPGPA